MAVVSGLALLVAANGGVAQAGDSGAAHFPDLRTKPPSQLRIDYDFSGRKLLKLSNTVWNGGDGPLEVEATFNVAIGANATVASQRVYTHDIQGTWQFMFKKPAGSFSFHPQHDHWHFDNFARYDVLSMTATGGAGEILRTSGKVTFCIIDTEHVDPTLEHSAQKYVYYYDDCGSAGLQGLSVGWGDMYPYYLFDQHVDVSGLADGMYWLRSTADPDDLLLETNDANNTGFVKFEIKGDSVRKVPA